jgi:hypothetical protein
LRLGIARGLTQPKPCEKCDYKEAIRRFDALTTAYVKVFGRRPPDAESLPQAQPAGVRKPAREGNRVG